MQVRWFSSGIKVIPFNANSVSLLKPSKVTSVAEKTIRTQQSEQYKSRFNQMKYVNKITNGNKEIGVKSQMKMAK